MHASSKPIYLSVTLLVAVLVNICACSEDGSLNCGYSSIRGRRVNMEDFYDIKSSRVDDKQINFFGVFDGEAFTFRTSYLFSLINLTPFAITGHGGTHAAGYLKQHLFENLLKHPAFIGDTKSAMSTMFSPRHLKIVQFI
jgi:protein phosphatase 1L